MSKATTNCFCTSTITGGICQLIVYWGLYVSTCTTSKIRIFDVVIQYRILYKLNHTDPMCALEHRRTKRSDAAISCSVFPCSKTKGQYTPPVFTGRKHGPWTRVSFWTPVLQVKNYYNAINISTCRSWWPVFAGVQKLRPYSRAVYPGVISGTREHGQCVPSIGAR